MGAGSSTPAANANKAPVTNAAAAVYTPVATVPTAPSPAVMNRANSKLNNAITMANSANAKVAKLRENVDDLKARMDAANSANIQMGGRRKGRKGGKGRKTRKTRR
jgi:hypothetical protein